MKTFLVFLLGLSTPALADTGTTCSKAVAHVVTFAEEKIPQVDSAAHAIRKLWDFASDMDSPRVVLVSGDVDFGQPIISSEDHHVPSVIGEIAFDDWNGNRVVTTGGFFGWALTETHRSLIESYFVANPKADLFRVDIPMEGVYTPFQEGLEDLNLLGLFGFYAEDERDLESSTDEDLVGLRKELEEHYEPYSIAEGRSVFEQILISILDRSMINYDVDGYDGTDFSFKVVIDGEIIWEDTDAHEWKQTVELHFHSDSEKLMSSLSK